MLTVRNLTKVYAKGGTRAVDDISLEVSAGKIYGFLGPNGAGKTTTIKMICGILAPTAGNISVFGRDVIREPIEAKKIIGYVNDSGVVFESMTGREYVDFMANIYNVSKNERINLTDKYLQAFNLTNSFDHRISSYSHGMKQKIALIGTLVHSPKLFILDEPMVGLDPQSSFELKNILRGLAAAGNVVFFSTHVLEVAEKMCDRVAIINRGKIVLDGNLAEIKSRASDKSLEEIFLSIANKGENPFEANQGAASSDKTATEG